MTGCIGGGSYETPIEDGFYHDACRDVVIVCARSGNCLASFGSDL
jgi:hypothetical protein